MARHVRVAWAMGGGRAGARLWYGDRAGKVRGRVEGVLEDALEGVLGGVLGGVLEDVPEGVAGGWAKDPTADRQVSKAAAARPMRSFTAAHSGVRGGASTRIRA